MCGIAGFVGISSHEKEILTNMLDCMIHRGPDSGGMWFDEEKKVSLGHRRLSIQDLSINGSQPMQSSNGRFVITYNGEIYNAVEILKSIEQIKGRLSLRGTSDTEVLLEAIDCLGINKTLSMAKGMFAFCVYDKEEHKLLLARDRFGEKPLYYTKMGKFFAFSSELSALMKVPSLKFEINQEVLPFYFSHGYIPQQLSIFKNVYKVKQGSYIDYDLNECAVSENEYWTVQKCAIEGAMNRFEGSFEEATEELERLIESSIRGQLVSDVPVGVCLSGGIDSTLISSVLSQKITKSVDTFSIGVENSVLDESKYAKEMAEILGTRHHQEYVSEKEMKAVIPELPLFYSEPFADSSQIPTYFVSKLAKKNVTVLLSGDAGDELFCGYPIYWENESLFNKLAHIPLPVRRMVGNVIKNSIGKANDTAYKLGDRISSKSPAELQLKRKFISRKQEKILPVSSINSMGMYDYIWEESNLDTKSRLMLLSQSSYLPDDILVKVDRAGMAVSVENRIPLLDKDIVEFAWTLPIEYKYNGKSKAILREILKKYIPEELIERPKQGFSIPVGAWIMNDKSLMDWANAMISRSEKSDLYAGQVVADLWKEYRDTNKWNEMLWYVLMFEAWREKYNI